MRRTARLLAGMILLAACSSDPTGTSAVDHDVAALRTATDPFHNIDVAKAAGFNDQSPAGCFASNEGGMGFHWVKSANVGTLAVTKPQFLMYEPQANGRLKLVALEYVVASPGPPSPAP